MIPRAVTYLTCPWHILPLGSQSSESKTAGSAESREGQICERKDWATEQGRYHTYQVQRQSSWIGSALRRLSCLGWKLRGHSAPAFLLLKYQLPAYLNEVCSNHNSSRCPGHNSILNIAFFLPSPHQIIVKFYDLLKTKGKYFKISERGKNSQKKKSRLLDGIIIRMIEQLPKSNIENQRNSKIISSLCC